MARKSHNQALYTLKVSNPDKGPRSLTLYFSNYDAAEVVRWELERKKGYVIDDDHMNGYSLYDNSEKALASVDWFDFQ